MKMFKFAVDNLLNNLFKSLISIIMSALSFFLIMFSIMLHIEQIYSVISCDEVLSRGIDGTAVVSLDYDYPAEVPGFFSEAYNQKEIEAIGNANRYCVVGGIWDELAQTQKQCDRYYETVVKDGLSVVLMNSQVLEICEMEIEEGIPVTELDLPNKDIMYVYLGAAYDNIAIGSTYNDGTIVIAGRMKEGQRWIREDLRNGFNTDDMDISMNCDYEVFATADNQALTSGLFLSAAEGYTIKEAINSLKEIAEKHNYTFTYEIVADMCETEVKNSEILLSSVKRLIFIVVVATMLMLISMQMVIIIQNSKDYGIMCAIGFSKKEIEISFLIRQGTIFLAALIMAVLLILYISIKKYEGIVELAYLLKNVIGIYVLPVTIAIVIVMIGLIQVITHFVLKKMTPYKLIRSNV